MQLGHGSVPSTLHQIRCIYNNGSGYNNDIHNDNDYDYNNNNKNENNDTTDNGDS